MKREKEKEKESARANVIRVREGRKHEWRAGNSKRERVSSLRLKTKMGKVWRKKEGIGDEDYGGGCVRANQMDGIEECFVKESKRYIVKVTEIWSEMRQNAI